MIKFSRPFPSFALIGKHSSFVASYT